MRIGALVVVVVAGCAHALPGFGRSGTCFFVSPSGIALTSYHVVDNVSQIQVRDSTGHLWSARVIAQDPALDIAALQISRERAPAYLPIAAGDAGVGDRIYTIASWTRRTDAGLVIGQRGLGSEALLSTTARAAPGSSGGPLVNADGEVIGLLVRLREASKIAFAVKSSRLRQTFPVLPAPARGPKLDRDHLIERTERAVCLVIVHD